MIRTLIFSALLISFLSVFADRKDDYNRIRETLRHNDLQFKTDTDTVVSFKGYSVKVKQQNDSVVHLGLNLFNPEWKQAIDGDLLDYIERDLLMQVIYEKARDDSMIEFKLGTLADFKKIDLNTPCNITTLDASILSVEWTLDNGNPILISTPVSYDLLRGGSRAEIEADFLSKLRNSNLQRNVDIEIDSSTLQPYGESEYVLPGATYINDQITRNIYLNSDKDLPVIWDVNFPLESINNLLICGAGQSNPIVDLTVIKHDYGEKEELKTPLQNLIALAEIEGCVPFWGLESNDNGKITGSLFLYNPGQGYDHVVKIECVPEEIIAGQGNIMAKVYLYIPSNNVSNLNEPYRVKTEDEKIKYWEN